MFTIVLPVKSLIYPFTMVIFTIVLPVNVDQRVVKIVVPQHPILWSCGKANSRPSQWPSRTAMANIIFEGIAIATNCESGCLDQAILQMFFNIMWRFPQSEEYPQSSSMFDWDFP